MTRLRAHEWAALLLDEGTAAEQLTEITSGDPLGWTGYPELHDQAPGEEAVRVYTGALDGQHVVLIAFDFPHLGGSMGTGVGGRVAGGFDLARTERLPVITVALTGGARMQEGMVALAQMARTTVAAQAHAQAGLFQVSVAADPTTGGVYASFLSQADLLVAEPGAYVGFAGPRVIEALSEGGLSADVNSAEWAHAHGLVDAVVPRDRLKAWLATALKAAHPVRRVDPLSADQGFFRQVDTPRGAWAVVEAARDPARPRARDYVERLGDVTRLHGDRTGQVDPGVIAGLAQLHGRAIGVVGLDREPVQPAGYRTAWRLMDTAERLGLPILTLVDTPGADATTDDRGLVDAVSRSFARLLALGTPTVGLVTGEGGSGGALALAVTDRLLVQEGAIFSVIAPEGAAAILHRDDAKAPQVAEQLKLTAGDLVELGIADAVAPDDPDEALAMAAAAFAELAELLPAERQAQRVRRWGTIGG